MLLGAMADLGDALAGLGNHDAGKGRFLIIFGSAGSGPLDELAGAEEVLWVVPSIMLVRWEELVMLGIKFDGGARREKVVD